MLVAFGFANMSGGEKRNLFRVAKNFLSVPKFSPMALMDRNRAVAGVNIGHLWREVEMLTGEMSALVELYRKGKIKPTVDSVFKFADVRAAHRRMHERKNVGKIVLEP
jgi:NADPH:quinone reductase-like Zn-dependent oxidoreductase